MKRRKITPGALFAYSKKALRRAVAFTAAFFLIGTSYAQITMQSGSYVGNGSNNRTITGAGFTPDVVMVKAANGHESQIKTSTMANGYSKQMQNSAAIYLNRILTLANDGFVIGTDNDVNDVGVTYYWTAFKAGADLKVGSYVGNDLDNRNITGLGMDPDMVFVLPESGNRASFRTNSMVGDECYHFGSAALPNTIQAFVSGGFQVGDDTRANKDGLIYHYVVFKASAGSLKLGTYIGNDVDDRAITGIGFQPEYMFIKKKDGTYAVQRSNQMPANSSIEFESSGIDIGRIKSFNADGFTVGTHAQVNDNNKTYYFACFRNGCAAPSGATAGSNSPICAGSALNLTSSVSGSPTPTASWSGAGTFSSTTVANPSVTGAATGNYMVTYTNACGSTSASTAVVVNTAPSSVTAGSNSPICEGGTLSLTSSASGTPAPTFSWTGPNSFTSTDQNPMITDASAANHTGTYIVTAHNSCGNQAANVSVTVIPTPTAGFAPTTFSGGNATLHLSGGANVIVTYNINGGSPLTILLNGSGLADIGPIAVTSIPKTYNLVSAKYASGLECSHSLAGHITLVNTIVTRYSNKDAYMRDGSDNTNEGANPLLRISSSGKNRTIVGFDMSGISTDNLVDAQLVMNIADNSDNWGGGAPGTRYVDAHRVMADWTEGNGWNENGNIRGTGEGVTWSCPKDGNIANQSNSGETKWGPINSALGGTFEGATAPGVLFYNGLTGDIMWDVTADVLEGAPYGWVIKKRNEGQNGRVYFQSKENINQPKLVLTYATASSARLIKNGTATGSDMLKVYPNPASGLICVEILSCNSEAKIIVCDITGREVAVKTIAANKTAPVTFDIADAPVGMYVVKAVVDGNTFVTKFVKK